MAESPRLHPPTAWLQELPGEALAAWAQGPGRRAFALRGTVEDPRGGLCAEDILVIDGEADAEPGDLVVWWAGSAASLALAEVDEHYRLRSRAGFPAPSLLGRGAAQRGPSGAAILGVVLGRLRQQARGPQRS